MKVQSLWKRLEVDTGDPWAVSASAAPMHPAQHPPRAQQVSPEGSDGGNEAEVGVRAACAGPGGSLLAPPAPFPAVLLSRGSLQRERGHRLGHSGSCGSPWGWGTAR